VAKTLVVGATFLDFIFFFRVFVLRLGVFASATKDQSITPRDELWFGETQKKRINSRFQKTPKRRKRGEREREREKRMAVLTELGEGQSAGLGLGHNSDVRIFRL
jgi:hypothetical protein|tara:strand:- start:87 stop:401 length:315 start_codon:yes stop_codon:yes gene_type:complete